MALEQAWSRLGMGWNRLGTGFEKARALEQGWSRLGTGWKELEQAWNGALEQAWKGSEQAWKKLWTGLELAWNGLGTSLEKPRVWKRVGSGGDRVVKDWQDQDAIGNSQCHGIDIEVERSLFNIKEMEP